MKILKRLLLLIVFMSFLSSCTQDEIIQEDQTDISVKTGGDGAQEPDNERDGDGG